MAKVSLHQVEKHYEGYHAVRGISLDIPDHAFVVLVGPSGCGKSTTLRMIAGLEEISSGEIRIGDRAVNQLPPGERDIAMVFQNYALYPHMTVRQNIAFGLKQRRLPALEIARRIDEIAAILKIETLLDRKPRALSGGQRQRVAMGRAMVRNPALFLFDEPLSNLDASLRVRMRTEIKRLHQAVPTTTIYVTHDQTEAMTLADIVVVMNGGRIEQSGPPQHLYHFPDTRFVAGFIGSPAMNFFPATLTFRDETPTLSLPGDITLPLPRTLAAASLAGEKLTVGIRPEHWALSGDEAACLPVTIDVVEPLGQETLVYFRHTGEDYCVRLDASFSGAPGEMLKLYPCLDKIHLFEQESGRRVAGDYFRLKNVFNTSGN
ncbi:MULTISPECIES: ABC transporter ATP-binding protein [unclassified Brenneria]|uniref:ABC transporter ATP-binding protein n=1 Tax=unclassified Brenneria TaxID=2634434 RepID=UPI001555BAE7|nr:MULTISPECIES: sn-glycerol-3-phosphate ABC transporter ATP-binding protein UgpC [unclassified Brenneria]MBJ7222740.1 sn-glycerol-3-phosphate ABC transporter ATP-binding protein UgpC [Brenneria sp. L3-3C-1]MEE3643984.1 sn-glycerol-3-phosphate ABC transporter ATP-binding protein UgpC [Brenneria sp. L3_3C_1]MEE3651914.1 sn-glycerol-3-phosphate ABC transporter ATP-binding protein UgpC [Brenneria sp. HEZEL_4_2_4]NPD01874.1 sn-glycerol-3-phosphate ABC transporter ATP-binding protein UgpC [Brenneria